jgi:hypothetical protein
MLTWTILQTPKGSWKLNKWHPGGVRDTVGIYPSIEDALIRVMEESPLAEVEVLSRRDETA